jgi:hypothetical protein
MDEINNIKGLNVRLALLFKNSCYGYFQEDEYFSFDFYFFIETFQRYFGQGLILEF